MGNTANKDRYRRPQAVCSGEGGDLPAVWEGCQSYESTIPDAASNWSLDTDGSKISSHGTVPLKEVWKTTVRETDQEITIKFKLLDDTVSDGFTIKVTDCPLIFPTRCKDVLFDNSSGSDANVRLSVAGPRA